jgi:integrase
MLSDRTKKLYESAYVAFKAHTSHTDESLVAMDQKSLLKIINGYINDLKPPITDKARKESYSDGSKLLFLAGVKFHLEQLRDESLPNVKARKNLKHRRYSNKRELSIEEIESLLLFAEKDFKESHEGRRVSKARNYILLKLLAGTGLRIGDILQLKVGDVKKPILSLVSQKTDIKTQIQNPLNPIDLSLYIREQQLSDGDYLFASGLQRKPLTYEQAYRVIRELGLIAGIDGLSPHVFRKYAIERQQSLGVPEYQIRINAGYTPTSAMPGYYGQKDKLDNNLTYNLLPNKFSKIKH